MSKSNDKKPNDDRKNIKNKYTDVISLVALWKETTVPSVNVIVFDFYEVANYTLFIWWFKTSGPKKEPSLEYEQTRRQIIDGVREMWYFFGTALKNLRNITSNPNITDMSEIILSINHTLATGMDHKR